MACANSNVEHFSYAEALKGSRSLSFKSTISSRDHPSNATGNGEARVYSPRQESDDARAIFGRDSVTRVYKDARVHSPRQESDVRAAVGDDRATGGNKETRVHPPRQSSDVARATIRGDSATGCNKEAVVRSPNTGYVDGATNSPQQKSEPVKSNLKLVALPQRIVEEAVEVDPRHQKVFERRYELIQKISRENGGVKISFPPEGSQSSRVLVKGPPKFVKSAKLAIMEVARNMNSLAVVKCIIPHMHHARVIGAKGANVQALSRKFDVSIQFPNNVGPVAKIGKGNRGNRAINTKDTPDPRDVVLIKGRKEDCFTVKQALLDLLPADILVEMPFRFHRFLVGRGGENIRLMCSEYRIKVKLPPLELEKDFIRIIGSVVDCEDAKRTIHRLVRVLQDEEDRKFRRQRETKQASTRKIPNSKLCEEDEVDNQKESNNSHEIFNKSNEPPAHVLGEVEFPTLEQEMRDEAKDKESRSWWWESPANHSNSLEWIDTTTKISSNHDAGNQNNGVNTQVIASNEHRVRAAKEQSLCPKEEQQGNKPEDKVFCSQRETLQTTSEIGSASCETVQATTLQTTSEIGSASCETVQATPLSHPRSTGCHGDAVTKTCKQDDFDNQKECVNSPEASSPDVGNKPEVADSPEVVNISLELQTRTPNEKILPHLDEPEEPTSVELDIDCRAYAGIIGTKEKTIKRIKNQFKVEVLFPWQNESDKLTITGAKHNVEKARRYLLVLEDYFMVYVLEREEEEKLQNQPKRPREGRGGKAPK